RAERWAAGVEGVMLTARVAGPETAAGHAYDVGDVGPGGSKAEDTTLQRRAVGSRQSGSHAPARECGPAIRDQEVPRSLAAGDDVCSSASWAKTYRRPLRSVGASWWRSTR